MPFNIVRRYNINKHQATGGTWKNWSENVWYDGPPGQRYIKYPRNQDDLRMLLVDAHQNEIKVRASGQRHSQPPQILPDNRKALTTCCFPFPSCLRCNTNHERIVIDMSFYEDIKGDNDEIVRMKMVSRNEEKREAIVVVNAGTREDEFTYWVTQNNLALKTVTAGGIFSIAGMTSNDVHGGSIAYGIFADTCEGFRIMKWDGSIMEVHEDDPVRPDGFRPIQFARVNLGLLGVVTQVFVKCRFRPTKQSLQGRMGFMVSTLESEFVRGFKNYLRHDRLETFYDPYTGGFLPLMWDLTDEFDEGGCENNPIAPDRTTAERALRDHYGSKLTGLLFKWSNNQISPIHDLVQLSCSTVQDAGPKAAAGAVALAMGNISKTQVTAAFAAYSETWLTEAAQSMFMSYFVEIPDLGEEGLKKTYQLLQVVTDIVTKPGPFHITAPMEFRFVRGGDSVMSGTYNTNPNSMYVNLDIIGFIDSCKSRKNPVNYSKNLLEFMATVERAWYNAGGLPHQGKMYGFFDPTDKNEQSFCPPFNDKFIEKINERRDERAPGARRAFNQYRKEVDPQDMFLNEYMEKLVL
mmetsp:Transcript_25925/g.33030  ORF Transcript_25925/g.33030 Transcript_25925/m.33030 type:complete len:577 (+) Transcript_25925:309-2039(+)